MTRSWHANAFCITGPLWVELTVTNDSPHKGPVMRNFDVFFVVSLDKESRRWWFETLWRSCDVTVMNWQWLTGSTLNSCWIKKQKQSHQNNWSWLLCSHDLAHAIHFIIKHSLVTEKHTSLILSSPVQKSNNNDQIMVKARDYDPTCVQQSMLSLSPLSLALWCKDVTMNWFIHNYSEFSGKSSW